MAGHAQACLRRCAAGAAATATAAARPSTVWRPRSCFPTGKKVVLIEDGPTLTHGGMAYGSGKVILAIFLACCFMVAPEQHLRLCPLPAPASAAPCCVPHIECTSKHLLLPQYAAEKYGAAEIVDPRPYLVGSMLWTYKKVGGHVQGLVTVGWVTCGKCL